MPRLTNPDWVPATRDLPPSPPPRGPAPGYTELAAAGLDPEQLIRIDALHAAAYIIGDDVSGTPAGVAGHLIDLAEPLVDWIRDGHRP